MALFTPRDRQGRRYRMEISDTDREKIGRGVGWKAEVTDLLTGKRYLVKGAACGFSRCQCDAMIVREVANRAPCKMGMAAAGLVLVFAGQASAQTLGPPPMVIPHDLPDSVRAALLNQEILRLSSDLERATDDYYRSRGQGRETIRRLLEPYPLSQAQPAPKHVTPQEQTQNIIRRLLEPVPFIPK